MDMFGDSGSRNGPLIHSQIEAFGFFYLAENFHRVRGEFEYFVALFVCQICQISDVAIGADQ